MNTIEKIVRGTRGTGNTTWILESALKNSKCYIVTKDNSGKAFLESELKAIMKRQSLLLRFWWKVTCKSYPKIITLEAAERLDRNSLPIIFDNSAFL